MVTFHLTVYAIDPASGLLRVVNDTRRAGQPLNHVQESRKATGMPRGVDELLLRLQRGQVVRAFISPDYAYQDPIPGVARRDPIVVDVEVIDAS